MLYDGDGDQDAPPPSRPCQHCRQTGNHADRLAVSHAVASEPTGTGGGMSVCIAGKPPAKDKTARGVFVQPCVVFRLFFARNLFRSVDESGMLRIPFERLAFAYLIGGQGAVDVAGEPADGTAAVGVA